MKSIRVSEIDAQFVKLLRRLKGNPDFVTKFLPLYEKALRANEDDLNAEIRVLETEIEHKRKLRKELNRRWLEGAINNADYREMKAEFDDEIEGLQERLGYVSAPQSIRELQWAFSRNVLLDVSLGWERGTVWRQSFFPVNDN